MSATLQLSKEQLDALRAAIAASAERIALALLGEPNRAMSSRRQLRFGNRGSLAIEIAGQKAGLWVDFSEGSGGDLIALIRRERGCDFPGALEFACAFAGSAGIASGAPTRATPSFDEEKRFNERKALAAKLWGLSEPLEGSPSQLYLERRGIKLRPRLGEALRFSRSTAFGTEWFPAMVAAIRDVHSNELIGVHLTAHEISGVPIKREGKTLRRIKGNKRGGAVKLSPDDLIGGALCVGEGIETSLSAMQLLHAHGWSTLDAGGLKHFPVLERVKQLTIAVDADKAGFEAARELTAIWRRAGRDVFHMQPQEPNADLNDVVMRGC